MAEQHDVACLMQNLVERAEDSEEFLGSMSLVSRVICTTEKKNIELIAFVLQWFNFGDPMVLDLVYSNIGEFMKFPTKNVFLSLISLLHQAICFSGTRFISLLMNSSDLIIDFFGHEFVHEMLFPILSSLLEFKNYSYDISAAAFQFLSKFIRCFSNDDVYTMSLYIKEYSQTGNIGLKLSILNVFPYFNNMYKEVFQEIANIMLNDKENLVKTNAIRFFEENPDLLTRPNDLLALSTCKSWKVKLAVLNAIPKLYSLDNEFEITLFKLTSDDNLLTRLYSYHSLSKCLKLVRNKERLIKVIDSALRHHNEEIEIEGFKLLKHYLELNLDALHVFRPFISLFKKQNSSLNVLNILMKNLIPYMKIELNENEEDAFKTWIIRDLESFEWRDVACGLEILKNMNNQIIIQFFANKLIEIMNGPNTSLALMCNELLKLYKIDYEPNIRIINYYKNLYTNKDVK